MRVLVIEDDSNLGPALHEFLSEQDYVVDLLTQGQHAIEQLSSHNYGLVVLDLNLPDIGGLDLLRQLRRAGHQVPVLILTARDAVEDRVEGLDSGADDYVTKPFDLSELAARVRAFERRHAGYLHAELRLGSLVFDTVGREVRVNNERINLSVRELSVLEKLMARAGKVVTKQQIVQSLSANDTDFSDNAVEVYIYRLRKRFEGTGIEIKTIRGFGYLLDLRVSP